MGRELRDIPTASSRFDKQDAGGHLLRSKSCQGLPIDQISGLSGDHVEVAVNPKFVALRGQVQKSLRGLNRGVLLPHLLIEDP